MPPRIGVLLGLFALAGMSLTVFLMPALTAAASIAARGRHGAVACSDIANMAIGLKTYRAEHGRYPTSLAELYGEAPLDPWSRPYRYQLDGELPVITSGAQHDISSNDLVHF